MWLIGIVTLVGGVTYFWSGNLAYLPGLVVGALYLWPFRRIRRVEHLDIYFRILWPTSLVLVVMSWVGAIWLNYTRWAVLVDSVGLIVNVWAVWMYGKHRLDQRMPSVFFPARTLRWMAGIMLAILVAVLLYWAGGKYETEKGTRWLRLDGLPMDRLWSAPVWTEGAWNNTWKVEYSNQSREKRLDLAVGVPLQKGGYLLIYENGQKIAKATYEDGGLRRLSVYDQITQVESVSADNTRAWRRDREGHWIPEINHPLATNNRQDDDQLRIEVGYRDSGFTWALVSRLPTTGDLLVVKLSKLVDYPEITFKWLPLFRTNSPWQVGLGMHEGGSPVTIVDGIVVWYR